MTLRDVLFIVVGAAGAMLAQSALASLLAYIWALGDASPCPCDECRRERGCQ